MNEIILFAFAVIFATVTTSGKPAVPDNSNFTDTSSTKTVNESDTVCSVCDVLPEFDGGNEKLIEFINANLRYPLNGACIEGRVIIKLVIDKNGIPGNPQVLRSLSPELDKEALRVMEKMPKWIPGKNNDKNVACYFIIPVTFKLNP